MPDYTVPSGKPLANKILIKLLPQKEKTSGGIILAGVVTKLVEAVVVLASDRIESVKQGDKILIPNGTGVEHELDGENFKFIVETDPFYIF